MKTYEQRVPILEFLYKKPGMDLSGFTEETPNNLDELLRSAFNDLQRSEVQLSEHVADLQSRNKDLEAYASTVAHDLKEPLAVMILTANLITKIPDLTGDEMKQYLGQIRSTAYQMNTIISTMLLFAKVSKSEAPVEQVDMAQIVANVLNRLCVMIKEYRAQIDLPACWPAAIGYAPWLEEVWTNYLSNALKHGSQPPQVELGASVQTNGMVRFWIRDHGPGIPKESLPLIFERFYRARSEKATGTGLGLFICKQIIDAHRGKIWAESTLGQGTTFFIELPTNPID